MTINAHFTPFVVLVLEYSQHCAAVSSMSASYFRGSLFSHYLDRISIDLLLSRSCDEPNPAREFESAIPVHHSAPTSSALPIVAFGITAVIASAGLVSGTASRNGTDGQVSPRNERYAELDMPEPAKPSSAPDTDTPYQWPQRIRNTISSPNLIKKAVNRSYSKSSSAPLTVIQRPDLASSPRAVFGKQDLDSFVPSPPFGFCISPNAESTTELPQAQSTSTLSQISTAPTSVLSSNNWGQNACK
jgi:hypothetical protein